MKGDHIPFVLCVCFLRWRKVIRQTKYSNHTQTENHIKTIYVLPNYVLLLFNHSNLSYLGFVFTFSLDHIDVNPTCHLTTVSRLSVPGGMIAAVFVT